ncbi:hypothetical protein EVG20_g871 [Dentipellis fragilis]|uniref:4a-hydroxytetrahydrobiopterin dehydratase n=1 Tax=Dentipellis fragilis TaxID=205917 RepID=A0A4Y9ZE40_9AGAM|nr:hypothetical protein EVG20_g871 [Dentipellis fragilis]
MSSRRLSQLVQTSLRSVSPKHAFTPSRTWASLRTIQSAHIHTPSRREAPSGNRPFQRHGEGEIEPSSIDSLSPPPALPLLSPPVGYRPLVITDDDIVRYIQPLYHRGWGIRISKTQPPRFVPVLNKTFKFRDDRALLDFVASVGRQMVEANHHPTITFTYNKLVMSLETHQAYLPSTSSDGSREIIKTRGITLKDIHMAYQAEHLYDELCEETDWDWTYPIRPATERPTSIHDLVASWGNVLEGSPGHVGEKVFIGAKQHHQQFLQHAAWI